MIDVQMRLSALFVSVFQSFWLRISVVGRPDIVVESALSRSRCGCCPHALQCCERQLRGMVSAAALIAANALRMQCHAAGNEAGHWGSA